MPGSGIETFFVGVFEVSGSSAISRGSSGYTIPCSHPDPGIGQSVSGFDLIPHPEARFLRRGECS